MLPYEARDVSESPDDGESLPPCGPAPLVRREGVGNLVLIIDDDAVARDLLVRLFRDEGYETATAADGETGIRMARELRPLLISLDVLMPGLDGWSVLRRLKFDQELADIPVMMITVLDEKRKGFALGASDYVTKPIDRKQLVAILDKYDGSRKGGEALIVEDDPCTRQMIRRVLISEGWHVHEAGDGQEAFERLAEAQPDIILLDLMMPRMDGFEFLTRLHATHEGRATPVVVITAADLTEADHRRLNGGVERIIQKASPGGESFLDEVRSFVRIHAGVGKTKSPEPAE